MFRSVANKNLPVSLGSCILWFDGTTSYTLQSGTTYTTIADRSGHTNVTSEVDSELVQALNAFRGNLTGITGGTADIGGAIPAFGANMSFFACLYDTNTSSIAFGSAVSIRVDGSAKVNNADVLIGASALNNGAVRTAIWTQSGTSGVCYLDGVSDASGGGLSTPTGIQLATFTASATAKIAEVAVYNKSLSASEVAMLHRYAINRWK